MPHKWDKEIRAFLDGKYVETDCGEGDWGTDTVRRVLAVSVFDAIGWQFRIRPTKRTGWINIYPYTTPPHGFYAGTKIFDSIDEAKNDLEVGGKTIRIEWEE